MSKAFEIYEKAARAHGDAIGNFFKYNIIYLCYFLLIYNFFKYFILFLVLKENNYIALRNLGTCYERGVGCNKDMKKAIQYYYEAIEKNNPMGKNSHSFKTKGICFFWKILER